MLLGEVLPVEYGRGGPYDCLGNGQTKAKEYLREVEAATYFAAVYALTPDRTWSFRHSLDGCRNARTSV